jgi:hypothetical protein
LEAALEAAIWADLEAWAALEAALEAAICADLEAMRARLAERLRAIVRERDERLRRRVLAIYIYISQKKITNA